MSWRCIPPIFMIVALAMSPLRAAENWPPAIEPLLRSIDLNVGESCHVTLADGAAAIVKLVDLQETRDDLRQAVRDARVTVEINGQEGTLTAAPYQLPVVFGNLQIDCPVTRGYVQPDFNPWSLDKAVRLRLWPANSPWIRPGTFVYPVVQPWFAGSTQMANEPVFVDGGENLATRPIYYHYGLDIGGAEGLVDVVAATDATVITAGLKTVSPPDYPPIVKPRYDVIYLRDGRGWYYRYSHLFSIDKAVAPGAGIKMGQKIGVLGKEGASGGWSHLHLDISTLLDGGKYGIMEGYAFIWQAYHAQHNTVLQAVARPHHLARVGENVRLDGVRSWHAKGLSHITGYRWLLSDGTRRDGATVEQNYARPGQYAETLEVTDADGRIDYDFAVVQVIDPSHPTLLPPTIHAAYWPTFDLKAGDEITFKVRSFNTARDEGHERWDFGDGSPPMEVQSDGNGNANAKDGYATTTHRYTRSGNYLVSVVRTNARGEAATARLCVHVQ